MVPAFLAWAQELPLPRHEPGRTAAPGPTANDSTSFLKPSASIKPPIPGSAIAQESGRTAAQILSQEQKVLLEKAALLAEQRTKDQRVTAALKRIVVMQGPVSKKLQRAEVLPSAGDGRPVTLVGIDAPREVVRGLESFFGVQLTPDNEKKLLDTVRKGMAGASRQERKVEVLGWWPKEGVMAVGVYPEG